MSRTSRRKGIEWLGGIFEMPGHVTGEGEPYKPEGLFWMGADGAFLGATVDRPGEVLPQAGRGLKQAIEAPLYGEPHAPTRVRVASLKLAEELRKGYPDIEIVCAPTPELDALIAAMREEVGAGEEPSYLSMGASPEAIGSFFQASAALFRAAPWEVVPDDQSHFSVTIEALDVHNAVLTIVGQEGENLGYLLFREYRDFQAFGAIGTLEAGSTPVVPPHFLMSFERGADLPARQRKEIAENHWEVADPRAYPAAIVVEEHLHARSPSVDELTIAEAIARALVEALADEEALQRAWEEDEIYSRTFSVRTQSGPIDVTLSAPYQPASGDLLARLATLPLDDYGAIDFDARKAVEAELLGRFGAAPEAKRLPDGPDWSSAVMDLAARHFGETIATLEATELEEVVFELFPRKVSVGASEARAIIAELRAFYAFLKREFRLPQADACLWELGGDAAERLEEALADPKNLGMAKSVLGLGADQGFGMQSKEGIEAFMQSMVGKRLPDSIPIPGFDPPRPPAKAADKAKKAKRKAARKARKRNR